MQPYQQRVVDEKSELNGKIEKLTDFIESDQFIVLDVDERHRMREQWVVMRMYSKILSDRIDTFYLTTQV